MSHRAKRCEAINASMGGRCSAPAKFDNRGRRVCGRHRRAWTTFVEDEPEVVDAKAEMMPASACADVVLQVMTRCTERAASMLEQVVREADWLWRRRFGDRGVRR